MAEKQLCKFELIKEINRITSIISNIKQLSNDLSSIGLDYGDWDLIKEVNSKADKLKIKLAELTLAEDKNKPIKKNHIPDAKKKVQA